MIFIPLFSLGLQYSFSDVLIIGFFFCQREDIHGDTDQYKFPDGAGISPEEGAAVLDRSILYLTQVGAAHELIEELEIQRDAALKL